MNNGLVFLQQISGNDNIVELTELLHRAYKRLSDMGLRFFATYQTAQETAKRIEGGYCFIAYQNDKIIATITLYSTAKIDKCEHYKKQGVWFFGQFAVEPDLQNNGIGLYCLNFIEEFAKKNGAKDLALDTSEKATHLINFYSKRGYNFVQFVQWEITNYRSVVLSKKL